jgi:hypothetical protein
MNKVNYNVIEDKYNEGNWAVEAVQNKKVIATYFFLRFGTEQRAKKLAAQLRKK